MTSETLDELSSFCFFRPAPSRLPPRAIGRNPRTIDLFDWAEIQTEAIFAKLRAVFSNSTG